MTKTTTNRWSVRLEFDRPQLAEAGAKELAESIRTSTQGLFDSDVVKGVVVSINPNNHRLQVWSSVSASDPFTASHYAMRSVACAVPGIHAQSIEVISHEERARQTQ